VVSTFTFSLLAVILTTFRSVLSLIFPPPHRFTAFPHHLADFTPVFVRSPPHLESSHLQVNVRGNFPLLLPHRSLHACEYYQTQHSSTAIPFREGYPLSLTATFYTMGPPYQPLALRHSISMLFVAWGSYDDMPGCSG